MVKSVLHFLLKFVWYVVKATGTVLKYAAPVLEIGTGIWDVLSGVKQMEKGGIYNNVLLTSRKLSHHLQEMTVAYTTISGKRILKRDRVQSFLQTTFL